ncbi:MAG: hypothetical protein COB98_08085 [Flavobacteriaceae bacterium]|nr:MAG: hypothetical protein COB98_08085 [Flavobacteriaceae bacterium]
MVLLFFISFTGFGQENVAKKFKMLYKFNTIKQADNTRLLEVSFIARNKKNKKDKPPVFDAEIQFYNTTETEDILLGTAKTDDTGHASITVPASHKYTLDAAGYINLSAKFKGTDQLKRKSKKIQVKDIFLELDLKEIDSVKTVIVKAFTIDSLGVKIKANNVDVIISIGAMISKMKIEEATLKNGLYTFEFPTDIPGNIAQNIDIYTTIEDHDEYGNVIQKSNEKWGVYDSKELDSKNTLWSKYAPLWMYILLGVLLGGIWINFIYTLFQLKTIKKEGLTFEAENIPKT